MITSNQQAMGGNGAYLRSEGGVPAYNRTHTDTNYRVDGHKVLLYSQNAGHNNTPMNSNSENPIYLCGKTEKQSKEITIATIAIYENHRIAESIDLKFDKAGDLIPFKEGGGGSHMHKWFEDKKGDMGRKSHDGSNDYSIPSKYADLINEVIIFNKAKKKWN